MSAIELLESRRIRNSHESNYSLKYFKGEGSLYPKDGEYLNPNSQYKNRFTDMARWIENVLDGDGTVIDIGGGPGHLGTG